MSYFLQTVATQSAQAKDADGGKFGAKVIEFPNGVKAILKFKAFGTGKYRSVPKQDMHRREVAVYRLDRDILKFNVVPETLLVRRKGHDASMQHFRTGLAARDLVAGIFDRKLPDWKYRLAKLFSLVNVDDLTKIVVLDLVINNADRHGKNVIFDTHSDKVWAIDNGLSFGPFYKSYRNIFHKYLFFRAFDLPESIERTLAGVTREDLTSTLDAFLSADEIEQTYLRIQFILDHKDRLDFIRLSHGKLGPNDFPTYEKWFKRVSTPAPEVPLVMDMNALPGWNG